VHGAAPDIQNAPDLFESNPLIGDVLHDAEAHDEIKGRIFEWETVWRSLNGPESFRFLPARCDLAAVGINTKGAPIVDKPTVAAAEVESGDVRVSKGVNEESSLLRLAPRPPRGNAICRVFGVIHARTFTLLSPKHTRPKALSGG
jgi:hypothetical protein